jgi:hypothetical protein
MKKLAVRSRHVNLFLGAGASKACGLPTITELRDRVLAAIPGDLKASADFCFDGNRTLEHGLSRLRRMRSLLSDGVTITAIDVDTAQRLDEIICTTIVELLNDSEANIEPYRRLAAWLNAQEYLKPIEVFTVNYDLLLEHGLESESVHYFDGFVGSLTARFRADLVDILTDVARSLPPSCVRLWKLHGSISWAYKTFETIEEIVRTGGPVHAAAALFPSDEKYVESRRVPFVVLADRLRRALDVPESMTIVNGYGFGDDHLNELLFDAARLHPRSEIWVTCFGDVPKALEKNAILYPNIVVHGATRAIVGGRDLAWQDEPLSHVYAGQCLLGNFSELTYLLLSSNEADDDDKSKGN